MGKLHSLRRAILREPRKWYGACGARKWSNKNEWYPLKGYGMAKSFGAFIKHVLQSLTAQ